jgi:hypothetical protein
MSKKITWFFLTVIATSVMGSDSMFQESFTNSRSVDTGLDQVDWRVNLGPGAVTMEGNPRGSAGPILSLNEYVFFNPNQDNANKPWVVWTEKESVSGVGEIGGVDRVSLGLSNENATGEDVRIALKIDEVWYVSDDVLNGNGNTIASIDIKASTWRRLILIPDTKLAVGEGVPLPSSGKVQAVGVFNEGTEQGSRVRINLFAMHDGSDTAPDLLSGFVHPPVIFNPGPEYGPEARNYQGIPGIECAPGGRLWATWYAGPVQEDRFNYVLVSTSGDDGKTWNDVSFVIDSDGKGPKRAYDPCLWLDPNGKLWLFFGLGGDGLSLTMAMTTDNPDSPTPTWTKPAPLFPGVMMNKPIVTSRGEWLASAGMWHRDYSSRVMVSTNQGTTWSLRGAANVPVERRNSDEHMIVERRDGSFWMFVRTAGYGIGESISTDNGKTWTEVSDYQKHNTTRFTLLKLQSGNLLLLRNGPLDERAGRDRLSAYLSKDDGKTWLGGLLLDERHSSYPDATQAPDGTIYAIYDHHRDREKEITMAVFTEQDILDGEFRSPPARARVLVNKATGENPLRGRIGEGPPPRQDQTAAPLITNKPAASLRPVDGNVERIVHATYIFSDSDYIGQYFTRESIPSVRRFVHSSIDSTEVVVTQAGMVYVLTPTPDRNPHSVEAELLAQGFVKTSAQESDVILKIDEKYRFENLCSLYQKEAEAGETIRFGKWGVLVF